MTKRICSIYFEPLKATRTYYQGEFALPAVAPGAPPAMLELPDQYQLVRDDIRRHTEKKLITGEQIAADLLREWGTGNPMMSADCGPGLWILRDQIALVTEDWATSDPLHQFAKVQTPVVDADGAQQFRAATKEEAAAMFAEDLETAKVRQVNWGERCIAQGDVMAENPKLIQGNMVPSYCRNALIYYGKDRKWKSSMKDDRGKRCRYCRSMISTDAAICPECGKVADVQLYAQLQEEEKQAAKAVRAA